MVFFFYHLMPPAPHWNVSSMLAETTSTLFTAVSPVSSRYSAIIY